MKQYIIREQVLERLSISYDTLDRLIKRGDIVAVKIGRCVRVELESVERYLREHTMGEAEA